jgi:hypothetical protein
MNKKLEMTAEPDIIDSIREETFDRVEMISRTQPYKNTLYSLWVTHPDFIECKSTLMFRTTHGLTLMDMLDIVDKI